MTNLIVYNYYYRYRQFRKVIKEDFVDSANYIEAKNRLESVIAEHLAKFPTEADTRKDFNYGEKIMLQHALDHLNAVIDQNDPEFTDNGIIKHQSDIVKEGLLKEPKQDYSDD